jgi:hypothetical protein
MMIGCILCVGLYEEIIESKLVDLSDLILGSSSGESSNRDEVAAQSRTHWRYRTA